MTQTKCAPVALFVYRRADLTKRVLDSLAKNPQAENSDLFIFSDGAKTKDAATDVDEVRRALRHIGGFSSVTIRQHATNLGLAQSITQGVSELCERFGRVVVVEDDLIVSPHFLEYMNQALCMYADDERVMQISGHMFPVRIGGNEDAFFLPFITTWGWATWNRAWRSFNPKATSGVSEVLDNWSTRRRFDLRGAYPYSQMLKAQQAGRTDSWGIMWYLNVFRRNGLVLYPSQTLVSNEGYDDKATHTTNSLWQESKLGAFRVRSFPASVTVSPYYGVVVRWLKSERLRRKYRRGLLFISRLLYQRWP